MKAVKKMKICSALAAALMMSVAGTSSAQQMNQRAVVSADRLTIVSVSPLTGSHALTHTVAAPGSAQATTQTASHPLQLDVNGTLDGDPFTGLWMIDHFEKRGKRIYAVGYLVNGSMSEPTSGSMINGTTINADPLGDRNYSATTSGSIGNTDTLGDRYYDATVDEAPYALSDTIGTIDYSTQANGDIGHNPLSDRSNSSTLGSFDTVGLGYSTPRTDDLSNSSLGTYDTLGMSSGTSGSGSMSGSGSGSVNGMNGSSLGTSSGTSGSGSVSNMNSSSLGMYDTLGMSSGTSGSSSVMNDRSAATIGNSPYGYTTYSTYSQPSSSTLNVTTTEVAVPVTISGATCDALYLRLGSSEKPSMGNAYRGVTADAGMQSSPDANSVVIYADDVASDQSSDALCTIARIVNGDGSTNALVAEMNSFVGAPSR